MVRQLKPIILNLVLLQTVSGAPSHLGAIPSGTAAGRTAAGGTAAGGVAAGRTAADGTTAGKMPTTGMAAGGTSAGGRAAGGTGPRWQNSPPLAEWPPTDETGPYWRDSCWQDEAPLAPSHKRPSCQRLSVLSVPFLPAWPHPASSRPASR